MSYKDFLSTVLGHIGEAGISDRARFFKDDFGRHVALVGDLTFTGNSTTKSITVRCGSHIMMFEVDE